MLTSEDGSGGAPVDHFDVYRAPVGSVEAERAILGLMLELSGFTDSIIRKLGPGRCFSCDRHRIVYQAMLRVQGRGKKHDLPTVVDELSGLGLLPKAGGASYLSDLLNKGVDSCADQYCEEIIRASRRTDLDRALWSAREGLRDGQDTDAVARQASAAIDGLLACSFDQPGYRLKSIAEMLAGNSEDISWCVKDLLPSNGLGILSGESGCGKTWLVLDLALAVAQGKDWLGRFPTEQGAVLFLDEESGEELLKQRLRLLGAPSTQTQLPIWITCFQDPRLDTVEGQADLVSEITRVSASLVLIDSLARVHRLEENSATEMKAVMGGLAKIARESNCAILLTHHSRKRTRGQNTAGQMLRGSSELKAAIDAHLHAKRSSNNKIRIEHEKARHGLPVSPFVVDIERLADGTQEIVADEKSPSKIAQAEEMIIEGLSSKDKPVLRSDLWASCEKRDIKPRTFSEALKRLQVGKRIHGTNKIEHSVDKKTRTFRVYSLA